METGVFKKVFFDDGAHVFVVRDMFRENNQRYGDEQKRDCADARAGKSCGAVYGFLNCFDNRKVRIIEECGDAREFAVFYEVFDKRSPVDDFEIFDVACVSEDGEERCEKVTCADTDDERHKLHFFAALAGYEDRYKECKHSAKDCDKVVRLSAAACSGKVADCAARKA